MLNTSSSCISISYILDSLTNWRRRNDSYILQIVKSMAYTIKMRKTVPYTAG